MADHVSGPAGRLGPEGAGDAAVLAGLARLSTALAVDPAPDELTSNVLTRIESLPTPQAARLTAALASGSAVLRRNWRRATAVAVALLIGLLAVTPAGARIAEWFGFGGVQIVQEPGADPGTTGAPDPASADGFTELSLDEARARVAFPLVVPPELGPPSRVLIGPGDRVVSMVWTAGDPASSSDSAVRLDQFDGQPDYGVVKQFYEDLQFVTLGRGDAIWLRVSHPLVYTDSAGVEFTERSRIAGPTLIWQRVPVTLRLEGVDSLQRALAIARSAG